MEAGISAGYSTGLKRWAYSTEFDFAFGRRGKNQIIVSYAAGTEEQFKTGVYSKTLVSPLPLFSLNDYYNYYWRKAFNASYTARFRAIDFETKTGFNDEWHSSVAKSTDYSFLKNSEKQRLNPGIENGHLRSIDLQFVYGDDLAPYGIVGQNRIALFIEYSNRDYLRSDFEFTTYLLSVNWRLNTFLKRRLLPNAFDFQLVLGTSTGELPVQKFFGLDGSLYAFAPYGTFRSLAGRHYSGEKVAALFWEHNFRTVPFELIGLDYLAKKGWGIILYGAHGRTWIESDRLKKLGNFINYQDRVHQEVGLSLNGLFGLMRIDFTRRIDAKGYYFGVGFSRFF